MGTLSQDCYQMPTAARIKLCALPGNDSCVDCGKPDPDWASLSHGTFICLECSGRHRGLGTHVSFVRSVKMDKWSDAQLKRMELSGGNAAFAAWLAEKDIHSSESSDPIRRYLTPAAQLYRDRLSARLEGREEPTELPVEVNHLNLNTALTVQQRALSYNVTTPSSCYAGGARRMPAGQWTADKDARSCQQCNVKFTLVRRRHHCRKCGRCVCGWCAPKENSRPIPEAGFKEPVRHCYMCYKSPIVDWSKLEARSRCQ
eukprot:TRINITY_DN102366_c0_g1_i1.p1 TRINITY_DN102366_c0_g1~~TRINITY_DN102366_c0_g1_i1.p1  ORF type:complete len:285 (+),score=27.58 TRINITY_DN102366_c0_g1_i1:82-855(+)